MNYGMRRSVTELNGQCTEQPKQNGSNENLNTVSQQTCAGRLEPVSNRETSEALFMSSGYVYDSAEQAAAAFRDETDNFVYSRYGNPTVEMFESRLALLEGAEARGRRERAWPLFLR